MPAPSSQGDGGPLSVTDESGKIERLITPDTAWTALLPMKVTSPHTRVVKYRRTGWWWSSFQVLVLPLRRRGLWLIIYMAGCSCSNEPLRRPSLLPSASSEPTSLAPGSSIHLIIITAVRRQYCHRLHRYHRHHRPKPRMLVSFWYNSPDSTKSQRISANYFFSVL